MTDEMKKILVPVDGSPSANRAARFAARLAELTGGSLTLVHVHAQSPQEIVGLHALSNEEIARMKEKLAQPAFDGAMDAIGDTDLQPDLVVALGEPAAEILVQAQRIHADLIVMGHRGLSPFKEWLLGSVSNKVLHHAECAVTIVR